MSKFVTCPAVTVLDNDHSLLIDDPNAGTNSITAENAGNTLLSKWAGFETFDEAVQNTIEHNQKFIDRDTAIREETADIKKKIVTTFPAKEASGAVATFESEFEDAPLKSCIVQIEPVQAGSGDPSPDNVRPITGWTGCVISHSGADTSNPTTYTIAFPTEAGTVYGGTLDVTSGVLTVDRAMVTLDENGSYYISTYTDRNRIVCNMYENVGKANAMFVSDSLKSMPPFSGGNGQSDWEIWCSTVAPRMWISIPSTIATVADFKNYLSTNPITVVYELATPIIYQLTPQEIKTLLGTNNIWADTGNTAVEYLMSDVSWYVEKKMKAFQSILAGVEDSSTASKNYSANTYLVFNDDIYRVTKAITAGETIEEGVNVTKTTVAEQLLALAQA